MRLVISRHARVLSLIATAGLLLAGCGSGPSQVGAAAIVGDTRIPVTQVQSWFSAALEKEPGSKQRLQQEGQMDERGRELASYLVQQELIEQTARAEGLVVDEGRVTDVINQRGGPDAATAGSPLTPDRLRGSVRMALLATELGRKYVDRLSIKFDYTQATTRREAESKARRMAEGPEQARAVLDTAREAGLPVAVDQQLRAADSTDLAALTPLFSAPPGTVLAFEPQPQSGQWIIARIKERATDAPATTQVAAQTDDKTLQGIGMRLAGATADRVGVRLSPRYGVWDPVGLAAAPNENETLGFWINYSKSAAS